jgi:hypothetical protein
MAESLQEKKKQIEMMQLQFNILKLETRILELDEEKEKIADSINEQTKKLYEIRQK